MAARPFIGAVVVVLSIEQCGLLVENVADMSLPIICCPHCGAKIEIAAREVQVELPLGPIEFSVKKKLDENFGASLQSNGSVSLKESDSSIDSNRIGHSEEELIGSIREVVGEYEWGLNSQLWRCYFQSCPDALWYTVRKWNLLSPIQQRSIKHPPAWLTDRYKRARDAITKARQVASG